MNRIIWLDDGPYVATEPTESMMCVIVDGKVEHRPSCMVSKVETPATREEVEEWRIRT